MTYGDLRVASGCRDTRTNCRCTNVHLGHKRPCLFEALNVFIDRGCKCTKLLPHRHRDGILQVRTSHFDHTAELGRLRCEGITQWGHD